MFEYIKNYIVENRKKPIVLFFTVLIIYITCSAVFVISNRISTPRVRANPEVEYLSIDDIKNKDNSQLAITDGSDYYSWYDYDRDTGKVYLLTRVDGKIVSITGAYGKDGKELYVKLDSNHN